MENGIPSAVNAFIRNKAEYRGKQLTVLSFPIWSTLRFAASIAAGPPVVATIDTTPRIAFSYGVGADMAPAGRAGVIATAADTNLQQGGQTRDQADVFIYGLSASVMQTSEPAFVGDIFRETDVQISTNGDTTLPLGTLEMFPGSGMFGAGRSSFLQPDFNNAGGVDGGAGAHQPFNTNGNPTSGSFFRLDAPIFWSGIGGGADSNLAITCTPRRTITKTSALLRAAIADVATIVPVAAFTPITAALAFVDVRWRLYAASVRVRSSNA
jgi:hypothetical protein